MAKPRAIPTSRFLVGILLHFCVPAYLLACLAAAFLHQPVVTGSDAVPARMLWTAAWFVPVFLAAMPAAAGLGAMLDRREERGPDAVAVSREALEDGRRRLRALGCLTLDRALARLDTARWDHADPRHQRIAADLAAAGRTFAAAHDSAPPAGRAAIGELAAESVERLADAMAALAEERRRLDEGDARTVAGYLQARYGEDTHPLPRAGEEQTAQRSG